MSIRGPRFKSWVKIGGKSCGFILSGCFGFGPCGCPFGAYRFKIRQKTDKKVTVLFCRVALGLAPCGCPFGADRFKIPQKKAKKVTVLFCRFVLGLAPVGVHSGLKVSIRGPRVSIWGPKVSIRGPKKLRFRLAVGKGSRQDRTVTFWCPFGA